MVNLSRIYTRTGDAGETSLGDLSRVAKTDSRVEAYGALDEANSLIGLALAQEGLEGELADVLRVIQSELFDVGADLANPGELDPEKSLRVIPDSLERLEHWCDHFSETLPKLRSFVLPGGGAAAATLHCARAVVRRAEREAWRTAATESVNPLVMTYLNRLSDLLFILARVAAQPVGETLWVPAADRSELPAQAAAQRRLIQAQQETFKRPQSV